MPSLDRSKTKSLSFSTSNLTMDSG
jgi:hypothetical protein